MKKNETFHVQKLPKMQVNQSFSGGRSQGTVTDNHKTEVGAILSQIITN